MGTLNETLGHTFANADLLDLALTHSSVHGGRHTYELVDYERLEFLGDRVLGLLVADLLMATFPTEDEGSLAKRHASLVQRKTLAEVALSVGIDTHMKLGVHDEGLRTNPTVLGDVCEAIIGALYQDGGLEVARAFVTKNWDSLLRSATTPPKDDKTELQEWAQKRGYPLPTYTEVSRTGPDHSPEFVIEVTVQGHTPHRATGKSKREGQQNAAQMMLSAINDA